ncbi:hypothetical protein [Marivita hallyeonensis]|uniref:Nucleoside 2-deoxyribosyltransferase n=1 Tax=Marivita hallyeonensis TaxID=996342 RepID=A0A1M5XHV7_9RHOB|nr:hypothetical protein [Marivita hallyeonensis]SHH99104.1 hypothetical protein SAMN05443551_3955 [Marivita hallyeonensis]
MTANKPPARTLMMLDQEAFQNAATAAGLQFKVFLAGPYIESTGKKPGRGAKNKAKRLRYALYHRLSDFGWVVTMGEYKNLINAANPLLGARNNAASAELLHAKHSTDAIVMLPSSPGSFLELGAFSLHADVCLKMLIIIDKKHEADDPNYLNTGPIPAAQKKGAKVAFIDYDDHDQCWAIVEEFVIDQGHRVAENKLLAP